VRLGRALPALPVAEAAWSAGPVGEAQVALLARSRTPVPPATPAGQCQIDHVRPYAEGGLTTQANGRPACAFHNRRRRC
jgi:hypothetical protein